MFQILHTPCPQLIRQSSSKRWCWRRLGAALLLSLLGCNNPADQSRAARLIQRGSAPKSPAPFSELPVATSAEERKAQLAEMARVLAPEYRPTKPHYTGSLRQGEATDHLLVLRYGHCYRLIGVGGEGLSDLDLALFDSNHVEARRDLTTDRYPHLGVRPSLCPTRSQPYRLRVQAHHGSGAYTVVLLQSPGSTAGL